MWRPPDPCYQRDLQLSVQQSAYQQTRRRRGHQEKHPAGVEKGTELGEESRAPCPPPHPQPTWRWRVCQSRTRCSSWFFSSSCASIWRSRSSMLPCLSSACRQAQRKLPGSGAGLGRTPHTSYSSSSKHTMRHADAPTAPWECLLASTSTSRAAARVGRGGGRPLLRWPWARLGWGQALGGNCAPAPAPGPASLRPPAPSLCGGTCVGGGAASTARRRQATFLSWEVSSHSLASLAAERPEDKRSDYKADQGQERWRGRRETETLNAGHNGKGALLPRLLAGTSLCRRPVSAWRPPTNPRPASRQRPVCPMPFPPVPPGGV